MSVRFRKPIYECRCNGILQTKRFTRLSHTGLVVELEDLKIKTRLTNEKLYLSCSNFRKILFLLLDNKNHSTATELARDGPRFGQTEAGFCLRFGLSGNRIFGWETEEEALGGAVRSRKFFFSETHHTVVNDT